MIGASIATLEPRVARALGLAERVVDTLLDTSAAIDLSALESPPDKVIAETALLLRAVFAIARPVAPSLIDQAHAVARRLLRHARSRRVQVHVALHPALARDYSLAHRCLAASGYPDAEFDALLQKALDTPQAAGRERLPHRELEQAWMASLGGTRRGDDLIPRTALGHGIDVLTGSRDDVYALTHAVLYATDLGLREIELPRPATVLSGEAESALAGALDDDDFDLAGEVILMWPLLQLPWSPASQFGLALLAAVEDEVGVLPSLAIDGKTLGGLSGTARRQAALATTYHTAYVMGLLCATVLRTGEGTAFRFDGERRPNVLREALAVLDSLPRQTRWEPYFRALPPWRQEVLASLALDVAIRRTVRHMELGLLHRLVIAACDEDIMTEALAQGLRLLDRVRLLPAEARDATLPSSAPCPQ